MSDMVNTNLWKELEILREKKIVELAKIRELAKNKELTKNKKLTKIEKLIFGATKRFPEPPKLVLSVIGDSSSFVPKPWLTSVFQTGLIETAKGAKGMFRNYKNLHSWYVYTKFYNAS